MTYRLAFIRTIDGYLKITASAKGSPTLTAIHLNPDILTAATRVAGLTDQQRFDVNSAANKAWSNELDVCCEAVELNSDQLDDLGFSEDGRKLA